jgi:hypothetical protein
MFFKPYGGYDTVSDRKVAVRNPNSGALAPYAGQINVQGLRE